MHSFLLRSFILIAFIFSAKTVISQVSAGECLTWQNPLPQGNGLLDVVFTDNNSGYILGEGSTLLKTTDGGLNWMNVSTFQGSQLSAAIYFINTSNGWYAQNSNLHKTANGGDTWSIINTPTGDRILSIYFRDTQTGWISGENGLIAKTTNAGVSWTVQNTTTSKNLTDIFFIDAQTGWASGDDGTILKTTNGGQTWVKKTSGTLSDLKEIIFTTPDIGYSVGLAGSNNLLITNDGGNTWTSPGTTNFFNLTDVHFANTDEGWIVGQNNVLLVTNDGGNTWNSQLAGSDNQFNNVTFVSASRGWIVGEDGVIYKTTNGGQQWSTVLSGSNFPLYDIDFIDSQQGWACGYRSILKTQNGGTVWQNALLPEDISLYSIDFLDANTGWVTSASGKIFATSNGGQNWQLQQIMPSAGVNVFALSSTHVWVCCENGEIWHTANSGQTWENQPTNNTQTLQKIYFKNPLLGWASGAGGTLLKTTDGGQTWTKISINSPQKLVGLQFFNEQEGWIASSDNLLMKTTNGGQTWTQVVYSPVIGSNYNFCDLQFFDQLTGFVTDYNGYILKTVDGGQTWSKHYTGTGNATPIYTASFTDDKTGWIAGENGAILKYQPSAPDCPVPNFIGNGINISVSTNISWKKTDCTDGYVLNLGTTPGGTDVLNQFMVGPYIFYDLPQDLMYSTTYYMSVAAFNGAGASTGCIEYSFTTEPPCLDITGIVQPSKCDANTGSITINVTGAAPPFEYTWADNPGGNLAGTRTGLAPGTYTVTITDANFCSVSANYTVLVVAGPSITDVSVTPELCIAGSGTITLTVSGGQSPYIFDWQDIPGANDPDARTGISAGNYTVTVTDGNGCKSSATAQVEQILPPTVTGTAQAANCVPSSGAITLDIIGNEPFITDWQDIPGTANPANRTQIAAGIYTVTVTDVNNCTASTQFEITENLPALVSISGTTSNCLPDAGTATVLATGGTPPFLFDWSDLPGIDNIQNRTGLAAGTYALTVTDALQCISTASVSISQTLPPDVGISTLQSNCFLNSGLILLNITGNEPFQIDWSDLIGSNDPEDRTGVSAGTYHVTVTDGNQCTFTESVEIIQNLPPAISVNSSSGDCTPSSGSIQVTISGGLPPYAVNWLDIPGVNDPLNRENLTSGNYLITVTDANLCTVNQSVTINNLTPPQLDASVTGSNCLGSTGTIMPEIVAGGVPPFTFDWFDLPGTDDGANRAALPSGEYRVTVSDANGCTGQLSVTVPQNNAPELTSVSDSSNCNNNTGSITLQVQSGNPPYLFDWSDLPGTNNMQDRVQLAPGIYEITISDADFCTVTASIVVNTFISPVVATVVSAPSCLLGTGIVSVNILSGTAPYLFDWSDIPGQENIQNRVNLSAGIYEVMVTDGHGCTAVTTDTIIEFDSPATNLIQGFAGCNPPNGVISVTSAGGISPYVYDWSDLPETNDPADRQNLAPGVYTVTVTDQNNCSVTAESTISVFDSVFISDTLHTSLSGSFRISGGYPAIDGSFFSELSIYLETNPLVTATIPPPPYSNNQIIPFEVPEPGNYTILLTDSAGCSATVNLLLDTLVGIKNVETLQSDFVIQPNPATDEAEVFLTCSSNADVQIKLMDMNGRLKMKSGFSSPAGYPTGWKIDVSNLPAGIYTVQCICGQILHTALLIKQ